MDIFIIKVTDANNVQNDLLKEFQKKEISNYEKWKTHCFSYLMVDRILREVYKIEAREIIFDNNKPVLKSREKYFSVSHSGEYVALGFADNNCGIDIEVINDKKNWRAISERMKFSSKSIEEFYKYWTEYEANYKLGSKYQSIYQTQIENYYLTAMSENADEKFVLYFQSEE